MSSLSEYVSLCQYVDLCQSVRLCKSVDLGKVYLHKDVGLDLGKRTLFCESV